MITDRERRSFSIRHRVWVALLVMALSITMSAPAVFAQEATSSDSPTPEATPTAQESTTPPPTPAPNPSPTPTYVAPTITSDKPDYNPGATVVLTGANWQPSESVHIFVNDDINNSWTYSTDRTAGSDGAFTVSFNLPSSFVAQYRVTATGSVSGVVTTTFTDAAILNLSDPGGQTKVGGVLTNNYDTHVDEYTEGDSINFRFTVDASQAASGTVQLLFSGHESASCFFFTNAFTLGTPVNITGANPTVTAGSVTQVGGNWSVTLSVTFSAAGQAQVYYTLTLSDQAGKCTGASQHVQFGTVTGDFPNTVGASSVNIPANDIIEIPDITAIKMIDRNGDGSFESSAADGEYQFCLDGNVNCLSTVGGQVVFNNVTPDGQHTVTEQQLVFTQGTYAFVSGSGTSCTFSGATATATILTAADPTNASCTFNNRLATGTLQIVKDFVGTAGTVDLNIDGGTAEATGVGDGGSTTAVTVSTATTHSVAETAAGTTNLANYTSSVACSKDGGATDFVSGPGTTLSGISVASGDAVVCTFTNTRKRGAIELRKVWSGTPGSTTLSIDQGATNIDSQPVTGDGTTGENPVDTGTFTVSESGGLANYDSSLSCFNDNGAGTGGVAGDGIRNGTEPAVASAGGSVAVGQGDDVVCTFTNTRKRGAIELRKVWSGTASSATLNIGTSAGGSNVDTENVGASGGTTGQNDVDTGTFYVSEVVTNAANYTSALSCFNDNGAGTGGVAGDGIRNGTEPAVTSTGGSVAVAQDADVVCTFTNTRNQGKLEVQKVLSPSTDVGRFNLFIKDATGTTTIASALNVGNGGTTSERTLDTATYQVSETAQTGTNPSMYSSSITCRTGNGTGAVVAGPLTGMGPLNVTVTKDADIVCVITNIKTYHPGTIGFWKNWRNQYTSTAIQGLIDYLKANNPKVYNRDLTTGTSDDLTIAKYDAIFDVGNKTPRDQMILAQLTGLKSDLAVTQLDGTNGLVQKNDDICLAGVLSVSSVSGATAFFGTSTPTVQQVVDAVENRWTGTLSTNRSQWTFNFSNNAQRDMIIQILTGVNEGWLVTASGC
jgi:hypothetical protein